nr:hypothetical protein [Paraburkholderia hospita]
MTQMPCSRRSSSFAPRGALPMARAAISHLNTCDSPENEKWARASHQPLSLGHGEAPKLPPMDAVGSGAVQEKEKAFLDEIIRRSTACLTTTSLCT